jgi:hypothetical protein
MWPAPDRDHPASVSVLWVRPGQMHPLHLAGQPSVVSHVENMGTWSVRTAVIAMFIFFIRITNLISTHSKFTYIYTNT